MRKVISINAEYGQGKHTIFGYAILSENSVVVQIYGGDTPHVGAVAIFFTTGSPPTCIQLAGHKEEQIVKSMVIDFAEKTGRNTVITAGIHVDNATVEDIDILCSNSTRVGEMLISKILDIDS
jgi:hypothetical protein